MSRYEILMLYTKNLIQITCPEDKLSFTQIIMFTSSKKVLKVMEYIYYLQFFSLAYNLLSFFLVNTFP